jgi:hypothetical protein
MASAPGFPGACALLDPAAMLVCPAFLVAATSPTSIVSTARSADLDVASATNFYISTLDPGWLRLRDRRGAGWRVASAEIGNGPREMDRWTPRINSQNANRSRSARAMPQEKGVTKTAGLSRDTNLHELERFASAFPTRYRGIIDANQSRS